MNSRILSIGLAVLLAAGPFSAARADTPANPDPPRQLAPGEVFTAPTGGAFVTDARATALLNAYKRLQEERDGFKAKLDAKPADTPAKALLWAGGIGMGLGVALTITIAVAVRR